jgi:hypothetical protein
LGAKRTSLPCHAEFRQKSRPNFLQVFKTNILLVKPSLKPARLIRVRPGGVKAHFYDPWAKQTPEFPAFGKTQDRFCLKFSGLLEQT